MARFDSLVASVSKMRGVVDSNKAFIAGMKAKLDELAGSINDEEDQAKVEAFASEFNAIADSIPQAIVENPAPGETIVPSTGGAKMNE